MRVSGRGLGDAEIERACVQGLARTARIVGTCSRRTDAMGATRSPLRSLATAISCLVTLSSMTAQSAISPLGPWFEWEIVSSRNPFSGVNALSNSRVAAADLNGDGDLDLLVGNFSGVLRFYENTGSPSQPSYVERTGSANPFQGIPATSNLAAPCFGDLDGDGDRDLLLGYIDGTVDYYRNSGTAFAPEYTATVPPNGLTASLPDQTALALGDLDADGDLDLLVGGLDPVGGTLRGVVWYYRNEGTSASPSFALKTGIASPIPAATLAILPVPALGDVDSDGDLDLVIGDHEIAFHWLENRGTAGSPVFAALSPSEAPWSSPILPNASPAAGDFDGDGDVDLIAGNTGGTVNFFPQVAAGFFEYASVSASSAYNLNLFGDGVPIHLIDSSGLSGSGPVALRGHDDSPTATTMWHAGPLDAGLGGPTGNPPPVAGQTLIFDLLGPHSLFVDQKLRGLLVWNHNQRNLTGRGVASLNVYVSSGSDPFTASFTLVSSATLRQASGAPGEKAQRISLAGLPQTGVRLVKLVIQSAHSGATNDYVGLSEIRFVPEPGSAGILAAGIAVLAQLRRARTRGRVAREQLIE